MRRIVSRCEARLACPTRRNAVTVPGICDEALLARTLTEMEMIVPRPTASARQATAAPRR